MMKNFCVYFHDKKKSNFVVWFSNTEKISIESQIPYKMHNFELLIKITKLNENDSVEKLLIDYAHNIVIWAHEIKQCKSMRINFDYFSDAINGKKIFRNHSSNIITIYKLLLPKHAKQIYEKMPVVSSFEYLFFEKCYNGSAQKIKAKGDYKCVGYDFRMSYLTILSSNVYFKKKDNSYEQHLFETPTTEGYQSFVNKLIKHNVHYGIYNCVISSDNADFNNMFHIAANNHYTHYDIEFCLKHKNKYNIKIEMVTKNKYNCLLYDNLIDGKEIFGNLYSRMSDLKNELPSNKLIKMISSSIWGRLSKSNTTWKTDEEIEEKNIEIDLDYDEDGTHLFLDELTTEDGSQLTQLLDKKKPYAFNYRLKPFLLSFQRILIAIIIQKNIKHFIRCHTDNIVFHKEIGELDICGTFVKEKKTSGNLYFSNVNHYCEIDLGVIFKRYIAFKNNN